MKSFAADYDLISDEYYDRNRHPTCANFREASLFLIAGYLHQIERQRTRSVLEVGAGRSVFLDLPDSLQGLAKDAMITDKSKRMLSYSSKLKGISNLRVVDAEDISMLPGLFDIVICSLADPYNTSKFWRCLATKLSTEGRCIATMPSHCWAKTFRATAQNGSKDSAFFLSRAGEPLKVSSYVMSLPAQCKLFEDARLDVLHMNTFLRSQFDPSVRVSNKIENFITPGTPVVSLFVVMAAR